MSSVYVNLQRYGNMSAACIPVALHEAIQEGRVSEGDLVLMVAFGGGPDLGQRRVGVVTGEGQEARG